MLLVPRRLRARPPPDYRHNSYCGRAVCKSLVLSLVVATLLAPLPLQAETRHDSWGKRLRCAAALTALAFVGATSWNYFNPGAPQQQLAQHLAGRNLSVATSVTVTHFAQLHWVRGSERYKGVFPNVLESQAKILKRLRQARERGEPAVFNELNHEALTRADWERLNGAETFKRLQTVADIHNTYHAGSVLGNAAEGHYNTYRSFFPNGIPSTPPATWTIGQQHALVRLGAANLLWAAGELREVHPADIRHTWTTGFDQTLRFKQSMHVSREVVTLGNLVAATRSSQPSEWIIVYGANHDFAKYEGNGLTFRREEFAPTRP